MSGFFSGQYGRLVELALTGRMDQAGSVLLRPEDILFDTLLGAGTAAAGYGIAKLLKNLRSAAGGQLSPVADEIGTCPTRTNSFRGETEVATKEGSKPIREIGIGDQVLGYNEITGVTGYYPVTDLTSHQDASVVHLTIAGEPLTTTLEHPFFTLEDG